MSPKTPLITVGMPVYNAMPYLPEAMESLLAQNFSDFAILAIDDGSTDSSLEYLQSIRDPRLRVVSQENRGLTAVLNRMLEEVSSPWLARHDADDVAYPDRLARAADKIKDWPASGMFYSMAEYYPAGSVGEFRCTKGSPEEIRSLVLSGYLPSFCHPSVTLNVAKAKEVGGYRFNLHVEDVDLWWRMALRHEIRFIPEVLVGFRQNPQSVSSKNLTEQVVSGLFIQYLLLSALQGWSPCEIEEIRPTLIKMIDPNRMRFKTHMRAFNMKMGEKAIFAAVNEAARAFAASPTAFIGRLRDEVSDGKQVSFGEDPSLFDCRARELWPARWLSSLEEPGPLKFVSPHSRQTQPQATHGE
jgi:glycosyltransferase involved in cell wall biosynthesis